MKTIKGTLPITNAQAWYLGIKARYTAQLSDARYIANICDNYHQTSIYRAKLPNGETGYVVIDDRFGNVEAQVSAFKKVDNYIETNFGEG